MEQYDWILDRTISDDLWEATPEYLRIKYWEEFADLTLKLLNYETRAVEVSAWICREKD